MKTIPEASVQSGSRPGPLTVLIVVLTVSFNFAASPTFWHVSTVTDLLKGEFEHLSIDETGRVSLAPETNLLHEFSGPFIWAAVPNSNDGFWVATGDEGRVYQVSTDGRSTIFFDADETEVHAVVTRPNGGLFVGTSPNGKVYEVQVDGRSTVLFDPEETYIWSMVLSADGDLYVATGTKGMIYRVASDRTATVFYDTKTTNVLSLAFDPEGRLLAGTDSPGRLLRIDSDAKGFVLLDSAYTELRGLHVEPDGTVYLAGINGQPGGNGETASTPVPLSLPRVGTPTRVTASDGQILARSTLRSQATSGASGAVIRVQPDGVWDVIWESLSDVPYKVIVDGDGGVLIGTGPDGRIYRLSGNPATVTLVTRVEAGQVTTMTYAPDGQFHFGTANPAKLFTMSDSLALEGTYLSNVRDAKTIAAWGTIRWTAAEPAGSHVELNTRTGNTRSPDEMWSDWSNSYRTASGEQVVSPKARYIQWRAVLRRSNATPTLTSVTTAYLPRNLAPIVTSITGHPAGTVFQKTFSNTEAELAGYDTVSKRTPPIVRLEAEATAQTAQPGHGRRGYRKGLQSIEWTAEDPDGDRLNYTVSYRQEGGSAWAALTENLTDPIFVWNTASVPDGRYLIMIEASDAPSNSPQTTLTGFRASTAFVIDNTPPSINIDPAQPGLSDPPLTFTAQDAQSIIEHVEVSLDGGHWESVYPIDVIADSRLERFSVHTPEGNAVSQFMVRVTDSMNNTATLTTVLTNSVR